MVVKSAVDGFLEHHVLDDFLFGDAKLFRLFGNLFVDKRGAHEAWADDIGAYAMGGAFLGDDFGKSDQPVFCGDVRRLEHGCLLGMHRAHINDAAAAIVFVHFAQNRARSQEGAF